MRKEELNNLVVFYADDDQDDQDVFQDVIGEIDNVELHTLDHGDELLHSLQNPPPSPHVVFLDLNMPGKNGFEVLREIRSEERFKDLPVVILSTSDDEQSIAHSRQLGANFYITKPNSFSLLRNSVQHVLNTDWESFEPDASNFVYKT